MSRLNLPYTPEYSYIVSEKDALGAVDELMSHSVLGVDTETTGLDPYRSKVLLLQIATGEKCYILNCSKVEPSVWSPVLSSPNILKIMHNALFDYKMLKVHAGVSTRPIYDTMVAEQLITAGRKLRANLAATVSRYLGITLNKEIRSDFIGVQRDTFTEDELLYAANDAIILHELYRRQLEILERDALTRVAELEFNTVVPLAEMELSGVFVDVDKWRELVKTAQSYKSVVEKRLREMFLPVATQVSIFGDTAINFASQPVLLEHLQRMGITIDGKPLEDTSDETLGMIVHPVGGLLREWRRWEKVCSSYGDSFLEKINPVTGRIHAEYKQLRAGTGRMSSAHPNAQQIPGYNENDPYSLNFRSCFVAKPGYKLVTSDYSQQELRILAALSGDKAFMEAYKNKEDLHTRTAISVFGGTAEEVKANGSRKKAKAVNFLLVYGGSAFTLAKRLNISEEEAQSIINDYFKAFPGVKAYMDKAADFAVKNGYSLTVSGRRRYYNTPDSTDPNYNKIIGAIRRKGTNTPIQGCLQDNMRVLTDAGYRTIADIRNKELDTNTKVWTGTKWASYRLLDMGKCTSAQIGFADGTIIDCDTRHKILQPTAEGYKWVEFEDITPGMKAAVSVVQPHGAKPVSSNNSFTVEGVDEHEFWWWAGAASSASFVLDDGILFVFSDDQYEWKEKCARFWSKVKGTSAVDTTNETVFISGSPIDRLVKAGVLKQDHLYNDSCIPSPSSIVFSMSMEYRKTFLDGFFTLYDPNIRWLRHAVADDIKLLLRSVGEHALTSVVEVSGVPVYTYIQKAPLYASSTAVHNFMQKAKNNINISYDDEHYSVLETIRSGEDVTVMDFISLLSYTGIKLDVPLYGCQEVSFISVIDKKVDTYTLSVDDNEHRFDCEGVITKNSAADVSKQALCNMFYRIEERGLDAKVIMIIHDELVCEAREDQAEEVAKLLEESMKDGFTSFFKTVPVEADVCIDDNWHH